MAENTNMNERIARVEWAQEQVTDRLSQGAEAFGKLRTSLAEVREDLHKAHQEFQRLTTPKPTPWYKIAGMIFGIGIVIIGWVWQASRYPDRNEFNSFRDKQEVDIKALREKQFTMATEQRVLTESMKRQEQAAEKIDSKLDRLLDMGASP